MATSEDMGSTPSSTLPDLSGKYIDGGRLKLVNVIGRGAWGIVYLAIGIPSKTRYAVKCVSSSSASPDRLRAVAREVALHNLCAKVSPYILDVENVIEEEDMELLYIVTEYCPDGDLLEMILVNRFLGEDDLIRSVFVQILDAVEACHRLHIFHRDLKPENILCKEGGRKIALADFGFATTERTTEDFRMGSEPFMSPEVRGGLNVLLKHCSSPHGDIWALGVILMNLACGCLPWAKASTRDPHFRRYLCEPDYLIDTFPISRELADVLRAIFTSDPRERIALPELRQRILRVRHFAIMKAKPSTDLEAEVKMRMEMAKERKRDTEEVPIVLEHGSDESDDDGSDEARSVDIHIEDGVVHVNRNKGAHAHTAAIRFHSSSATHASSLSSASTAVGALLDDTHLSSFGGCAHVPARAYSAPGLVSDYDAEDEDDEGGPITPEQRPADAANAPRVVALEEVPDISDLESDIGDALVADLPAPFEAVVVAGKGKRVERAEDLGGWGATEKKHAAQLHGQDLHGAGAPSARRMLRNAAKMMGIKVGQ